MTAPAPLVYPLASLFAEPAGIERRYDIHGATISLPDDLHLAEPIDGTLRIARTNRGVYVHSALSTAVEGECARCLRSIEIPMTVEIDEEVLPSLDPVSGHRLDTSTEPDVARLTDHHELDLGALVADAISLAQPIAPLCEPDCPGLCVNCGERLGPGHAAHTEDEVDPRLAVLKAFRVDGDGETG
jgi:uncharacterized protein